MNFIKQDQFHAINLQSAETDAALPMDEFNGLEIHKIRYLPEAIITSESQDKFFFLLSGNSPQGLNLNTAESFIPPWRQVILNQHQDSF